MSSTKLFASLVIALSLNACGSSGSGAPGGTGGTAGQGTGGTAPGTGGAVPGTGGAAGSAAGGAAGGGTGGGGGVPGAGGGAGSGGAGAAAACGDSTGPSSGDGCNTLAAANVCVQEMSGTGAPPTAGGGTIMEGTYELMSKRVYGATDAAVSLSSERGTIMISSVTAASFVLDTLDQSGTQETRAHGPVTISGSTATFVPTCPTAGTNQGGTVGFSATGATLTIIETSAQGTTVSVYIKH
jgi:hypothetical protein